jgi:dTDP-4-amino-4,6-dideoxygalactose transaminase
MQHKMSQQVQGKIPIKFSAPYVDYRVLDYIKEVIDSGKLSGDGAMCKYVEKQISALFGIKHVLLTTSCTHGLEMAMMILDLKPGDEVITPSFTFVSTANAIIRGGGKPVFCEINDRTLTMDPRDFEKKITPQTKAVIPVHYAGVAAEMDEIMEIARKHKLCVVEDAAQGVGAQYRGKYLGGIGDSGAFSFHDTKNIVSGEGGAFVTNMESLSRRAEIVREKGTNRANFFRGEVDKYTWIDHGSSYILSEVLAAILKFQFDIMDEIQGKRAHIYSLYNQGLIDLERIEKVRLPIIPDYCKSNFHIYYILLRNESERNRVMEDLKGSGVNATFHYIPLHSAPYAVKNLKTGNLRLPITDRISGSLLRLPLHPAMKDEDVGFVIEKLHELLQ